MNYESSSSSSDSSNHSDFERLENKRKKIRHGYIKFTNKKKLFIQELSSQKRPDFVVENSLIEPCSSYIPQTHEEDKIQNEKLIDYGIFSSSSLWLITQNLKTIEYNFSL